jgi:uncharacterized protein (DUF1778 family)
MPKPKPKPVGRPVLAKGEAKAKIVPVRLDPDDYKIISWAAKAKERNLSAWIRHTLRTTAEAEMFDGTLHKAMEIILLERDQYSATTLELSIEIERRGLYARKDGEAARAKQINARARKYPEIFEFALPGRVRLKRIPTGNVQ